MRVVVITQDDPFYLAENLEYLIINMPSHSKLVGCVVNDVSPFGKKENFAKKAVKTYNVFGLKFFIYYSFQYLSLQVRRVKNVDSVLSRYDIDKIILNKSINSQESVDIIQSYKPDLLISILGNQIFKEAIINLAPKGCLNLHTALLPKYRGLMPTFWVLKNSEEYTGVSVFFVDEGIDSGPIVVQKRIKIGNMTQRELIRATKKLGMDAIVEAIDSIEKGKIKLIENDSSKKTYYSFPTRKDVNEFYAKGKKFF